MYRNVPIPSGHTYGTCKKLYTWNLIEYKNKWVQCYQWVGFIWTSSENAAISNVHPKSWTKKY